VFLTSFVCAQYGSPVGNSNPGYGGTGSSAVPSGDYGHKGQNTIGGGASGSDGNSEVSFIFISFICVLYFNTNHIFTISRYYWHN